MSIQLRIILQYATERCISSSKKKKKEKKRKKSSYNFMNLWQINRQGCSSQGVAQWTFHVSGSQGRCMRECACMCVSGKSLSHTQTRADSLENYHVFIFVNLRLAGRECFPLLLSSPSNPPSTQPRCMVGRLRQPQGSQAESHWWTTTPLHPDPSIWPLSHFYYRRITISRSPTPPWDFATVF